MENPMLQQAIAGICAGFTSTLILHPLDLIKTRLQVSVAKKSVQQISSEIYRKHHIKGFYQGLTANWLGNCSSWGIYFFWYTFLKEHIRKSQQLETLSWHQHLSASAISGIGTALITNPLWVLKTRLCVQDISDPKAYKGVIDAIWRISKEEGWRGFYKGIGPSIFGVSHGAVQFMVYEELKNIHDRPLSVMDSIWMSSLSKVMATLVTYPYQVFKSRLQNHQQQYLNSRDVFKQVLKSEGLKDMPSRFNGADNLIQQRRKDEEEKRLMVTTKQYFQKGSLRVQFEKSTDQKIFNNQVRRKYNEYIQRQQEFLEEKRLRLKKILEEEKIVYQQSNQEKVLSKEDKIEEMRQKVQWIKETREAERQKVVQEKLLLRWRKDCDELRLVQSKLFEKQVTEERSAQLIEKQQMKLKELEEKKYYDRLWEEDRQKKVQREEREELERQKREEETISMLNQQMEMIRKINAEQLKLKKEEARLMLEEIEMKKLEEERKKRQIEEQQHKVRMELDRYNKYKLKQKAKAVQASLAFDLEFLAQIAKQDEKRKAEEQLKKEIFKYDVITYRDYLVKQRIIEKEREKEIDALIQADMERAWAEKEEKWKREQEHREQFMDQVLASRAEQMKQRKIDNIKKQEAAKREQEELSKIFEQDKLKDHQKKQYQEHRLAEYRILLAQQVHDLRERRRAEEEKIQKEIDAIKALEDSYTDLVKKELMNVEIIQRPFFGVKKSEL